MERGLKGLTERKGGVFRGGGMFRGEEEEKGGRKTQGTSDDARENGLAHIKDCHF